MIEMKSILSEISRSKQLRKPMFFNALLRGKFTSAYHKTLESQHIFRGIRGSAYYPYWVVQPSKTYRTSKNTNNFYTGLLDKLPSWSEYPKRSRSVICTTGYDAAQAFGNVLQVFPQNGAKIGICSMDDFWASFPFVKNRIGIYAMDEFNSIFTNIFREIYFPLGRDSRDLTEETYNDFFETLNEKVSKEKMFNQIEIDFWGDNKSSFINDIEQNFNGDWEEYFDGLLNPESNRFELQTIETFNIKRQRLKGYREIWTDAVSLMIDADKSGELIKSPIKLPSRPGDPNLDITI